MLDLFRILLPTLATLFHERRDLVVENLLLRHQAPSRAPLAPATASQKQGSILLAGRSTALPGFQTDQPAVQAWRFEKPEAARVRQPAILFLGQNSTRVNPIREPVHRTLLSWLPNAQGHTLEEASHLLPLQEPAKIAAALTAFYKARAMALNHGTARRASANIRGPNPTAALKATRRRLRGMEA